MSGEQRNPSEQPPSPSDRIQVVYERLADSVRDEEGYGGGVNHRAEINGWTLTVATSEFGDRGISMRQDNEVHFFELGPGGYTPSTTNTSAELVETLADLAERAEWQDLEDPAERAKGFEARRIITRRIQGI